VRSQIPLQLSSKVKKLPTGVVILGANDAQRATSTNLSAELTASLSWPTTFLPPDLGL
jgi:hypothetical protein